MVVGQGDYSTTQRANRGDHKVSREDGRDGYIGFLKSALVNSDLTLEESACDQALFHGSLGHLQENEHTMRTKLGWERQSQCTTRNGSREPHSPLCDATKDTVRHGQTAKYPPRVENLMKCAPGARLGKDSMDISRNPNSSWVPSTKLDAVNARQEQD